MNEIKDALLRMVNAGRKVEDLMEAYVKVGLNDNPLHEAYGEICEAIYTLLGEHTEAYKDSITCVAMTAPFLTNERRAEILLAEYRKNHAVQPRPNTMSSDGMKELFSQNGGYMHETPEGDWR